MNIFNLISTNPYSIRGPRLHPCQSVHTTISSIALTVWFIIEWLDVVARSTETTGKVVAFVDVTVFDCVYNY